MLDLSEFCLSLVCRMKAQLFLHVYNESIKYLCIMFYINKIHVYLIYICACVYIYIHKK